MTTNKFDSKFIATLVSNLETINETIDSIKVHELTRKLETNTYTERDLKMALNIMNSMLNFVESEDDIVEHTHYMGETLTDMIESMYHVNPADFVLYIVVGLGYKTTEVFLIPLNDNELETDDDVLALNYDYHQADSDLMKCRVDEEINYEDYTKFNIVKTITFNLNED